MPYTLIKQLLGHKTDAAPIQVRYFEAYSLALDFTL